MNILKLKKGKRMSAMAVNDNGLYGGLPLITRWFFMDVRRF